MKARFTAKQSQYLAFFHYYTKVNDCPPAEADMQRNFRVTPPTVHQMVLVLEARGLIKRTPGRGSVDPADGWTRGSACPELTLHEYATDEQSFWRTCYTV
jgi:hypothetical protein